MGSNEHFVSMGDDDFVDEAVRIVESASKENVILRLLGAMAIYVHSRNDDLVVQTMKEWGRLSGGHLFSDLDVVAYSKQRSNLVRFFERTLRFEPDKMVNAFFGQRRLIYYNQPAGYHVDIFFDRLEFSHTVQFGNAPGKGRLELDNPTISLADIVLTKLQIHDINLKDLKDLNILFLGHDVAKDYVNKETIDAGYIARVLSDDWGFWYDATTNLKRTADLARTDKISEETSNTIRSRISYLLSFIEGHPKTKSWEKRAKVGTERPWYQEVEEVI